MYSSLVIADLGDRAELIEVHHHTVRQLPAMLIGDSKDLTVQLLDDQRYHKMLAAVFFGKYDEDGRFCFAESLGIDGGIETKNLLKLTVEECVQTGQCRWTD